MQQVFTARNHRWCCCCCVCLWLDRSTTKEQRTNRCRFLVFFFHPRTRFFITPPYPPPLPPHHVSTYAPRKKSEIYNLDDPFIDNNKWYLPTYIIIYLGRILSCIILLFALRVGRVLSKPSLGQHRRIDIRFSCTICNIIMLNIRIHVLHFFFSNRAICISMA